MPSVAKNFPRCLWCLTPLVLSTVLCLMLKENFPFSHFPMYSAFGKRTHYVYLTDGKDRPVPVESITYVRTGRLKKIFNQKLAETAGETGKKKRELTPAERSAAGEHTLRWLYEVTRPGGKVLLDELGSLRLYDVDVTIEDGERKTGVPELVGKISVPPRT